MSAITYPLTNDDDILRNCHSKCGVITATDDWSYFACGCMFCGEKFLYFDAFIGHVQTEHALSNVSAKQSRLSGHGDLKECPDSLLLMTIKEEIIDDVDVDEIISSDLLTQPVSPDLYKVKNEPLSKNEAMDMEDCGVMDMGEAYGNGDEYTGDFYEDDDDGVDDGVDDEHRFPDDENIHYDDLVEESLLDDQNLTMHIKDRKMIKFLIDSYRSNTFLWDHHHPQFRDRAKRQKFLEWIIIEFKRRFNVSLARDAVTRKWDNLRTVYKREVNRMTLEKTNVSTLWYFKELHFLNSLYGSNKKVPDAVVKDSIYRRRYSALWSDVTTAKLLKMVQKYPCFYEKYHADYRMKDKRGEALAAMSSELQDMIDVTAIQISKRISQLRFDYSKQKQERLLCEQTNKIFVPSYTYYEQMKFMDADIAPFKCVSCPLIMQTPREMEMHLLTHQPNMGMFVCTECNVSCEDPQQLLRHQLKHKFEPVPSLSAPTMINQSPPKEAKYFCDLCSASFREKCNYDEHMRRHNDELFMPSLLGGGGSNSNSSTSTGSSTGIEKPFGCDICDQRFDSLSEMNTHRTAHADEKRPYKCEYVNCAKTYAARHSLGEHTKTHMYGSEDFKCDICGKGFRSQKNLQNHRQIHDAIKKYVCKVCGSAFAQAAGLYLHKRRHNRPNSRMDKSQH